ncbi:MAG: magnesium/cobalt transporter CorA [Deltaproteobacteria bacterium]|nr:magnesium/cobalt transporter CorA [Deltaproteobacteria bacterium]
MLKFIKRSAKKTGLAPGTLVHVGERKVEKIRIRTIEFDEQAINEREFETIDECLPLQEKHTVNWINIDGLHDVSVVEEIGNRFGLHSLVMEDILHTDQRPKMEDFEDYIFIVAKMLSFDQERNELKAEQLSLVLGRNYVVTFQERAGDVFEPVRERLRKGKGRIRGMPPDYLAYALIDAVVDHYFIVLEKIGETVESLEEELVTNPTPETLQIIHHLKRELIFLRKSVWPLRELISRLERGEASLVQEKTTVFLRDVYDHTIQVIDTVESLRDMVSGMLDVYLSSLSNRMNEVMKVLTIIATIFIPMTFIAGIYGMNFEVMPELKWPWGYPLVWCVILAIGMVMLGYFKKKKWL